MIARACDGDDSRSRLGASNAVWPVQSSSEQRRRGEYCAQVSRTVKREGPHSGCVKSGRPDLVRLLPLRRFAYRVAAAIPKGYTAHWSAEQGSLGDVTA